MAVINDPNTAANIAAVGEKATGATGALHVIQRALPSSIGHYRTSVVLTMATTQGANSRLFEIRNTHATNLVIPTRIRVGAMVTGTVTTAYLFRLGLYRCPTFSAVDTTNTVTPTTSLKRASMTAYPGNANVRHVTIAGAAGGMTGGTLTKDANEAGTYMMYAAGAAPAAQTVFNTTELLDDVNGTYPWTFVQNEGFEIENVTVGSGTANVVTVLIDVSWAEVAAY